MQLPTGQGVRKRYGKAKKTLSSKDNFLKALYVKPSQGFAPQTTGWCWSNSHTDPSPPNERTWKWWNFANLWIAYGFSTGVWSVGSSMISAGLTPWQAVICVFIAHLLGAIAIVFNSRMASVYHVGYPTMQRVSFGMWGSWLPVLIRCVCGIIWVGVQLYQGGVFTAVMLRCIFGHKFTDIVNTIPEDHGITVQVLIGVIIFWIVTFPLLFMRVHNTRYLWTIKVFVLPPAVIGLFAYCMSLTGGANAAFASTENLAGSSLAWTMMSLVNSAMGKTSTSQVNAPDLSRYAYSRTSPVWSQLLALPVANTAVACLGIFATSSVNQAWGELTWNPWDLCGIILDRHWTAGARTGIFFVSFAFTLSIFVSNQAANVIPFGADVAGLMPRFLNINRGQALSHALGLVVNPWYILASASTFLTFLGGYSVFLGAIVGASVCDYFWRRGNVDVLSMFTGTRESHYWYKYGVNWRAIAAFLIGCVPTLPGFASSFGHEMPAGAVHLYSIGWLFSLVVGAFSYFVFAALFPDRGMTEARRAPFESWAELQRDLLDRTGAPSTAVSTIGLDEDKEAEIARVKISEAFPTV